jgi:hypothetical protein
MYQPPKVLKRGLLFGNKNEWDIHNSYNDLIPDLLMWFENSLPRNGREWLDTTDDTTKRTFQDVVRFEPNTRSNWWFTGGTKTMKNKNSKRNNNNNHHHNKKSKRNKHKKTKRKGLHNPLFLL